MNSTGLTTGRGNSYYGAFCGPPENEVGMGDQNFNCAFGFGAAQGKTGEYNSTFGMNAHNNPTAEGDNNCSFGHLSGTAYSTTEQSE